MAISIAPAFLYLGLPLKFDWRAFLLTYWVSLTLQSVFLATLFYLLTNSFSQSIRPVYSRLSRKKPWLLIFTVLVGESVWLIGLPKSILISIALLGIVELTLRHRENHLDITETCMPILRPALYLFIGFIVIFSFNNVIASQRFYGAYDETFKEMDAWFLNGSTVSAVSHNLAAVLPKEWSKFLEFVYFGMFPQIGAALIFIALTEGAERSTQFVGTILLAYYLALLCYALWPSLGPFYSCAEHFSKFDSSLETFRIQKQLLANLETLWENKTTGQVGLDYFIAFPCMHLAQPIVVMWYLKSYRGILACLCAFNMFLVMAILLLEWHYLIDLLGGVAVALVAIAIIRKGGKQRTRHKPR